MKKTLLALPLIFSVSSFAALGGISDFAEFPVPGKFDCVVAPEFAGKITFVPQKKKNDPAPKTGDRKAAAARCYGRIKIVNNFEDFRVKVVTGGADLRVRVVDKFPNSVGRWQYVDNFENFRVRFVENFEDFRVVFVENLEGL